MSNDKIIVKPMNLINYTCKQSRYSVAAKLPMRSILLAPSNSGKTVVISFMITDIYKSCFSRIYIMSPSVHLDQTYEAIRKYQENTMGVVETEKEKLYFDEYDPEALSDIIENQKKLIIHMKTELKKTKMFSILIVIDDFADNPSFSRNSKLLHSLFTRGRHSFISTIVSTQSYTAIAPILRKNASMLIVFKIKNIRCLETLIEELAGLTGKKELLEMYNLATEEQYSFLYINLMNKLEDMFYIRFDKKLKIE